MNHGRRMRTRSISIYAENEEEYIKVLDTQDGYQRRSRLSRKTFDIDDEESMSEMREIKKEYDDVDDDYSGLGASDMVTGDEASEEEKLINQYQCLDSSSTSYERGIDMLCLYLKNSINSMNKHLNGSDTIFYKNRNCLHTLSGNAIYDINMRELVDNIINDNNEANGESNGLKDFIYQNIGAENFIKIMLISNNSSLKFALMNQFIGNSVEEKKDLILPSFDIKKKKIKLFQKNISLEVFDTSITFLNQPTSFVYYQLSNAFIFLIDASCKECSKFIEQMLLIIDKYSANKTIALIAFNLLFEDDCTIDGENLKEISNEKGMIYFNCTVKTFDMRNKALQNLLSLILIKKIDMKVNKSNSNKEKINIKKYENKFTVNKKRIQNCLGYTKQYRIRNIDAFDFSDEEFNKRRKRSLSINI